MFKLTKLFVAALALAPAVLAQNACKAKSTEIQSDGDVSVLEGCTTVEGDVIVGEDVTSFSLSNVRQIKGALRIVQATELLSIELGQLGTIGGDFELKGLTRLSSLNAPSLSKVGSIDWVTLPSLTAMNVGVTEADNVIISDTNLLSLEGINLKRTGTFDINNNKFLKNIDVQIVNVTESLSITFNKPGVIANFPNLETAKNISFRDVGSVTLPSLKKVQNSIAFVNNSLPEVFLPNLTEVTAGSISWYSNKALTNISAPRLTKVGGTFQIANNTKLMDIDGFPKLAEVGGAVDLAGGFKNATLPSLEDVRGGFNFQTTDENFVCDEFDGYHDDQVIKGDDYVCDSALEEALTKDGAEGGNGGSGKKDDKKNAGGRVSMSIVSIVGVAVGAVALML